MLGKCLYEGMLLELPLAAFFLKKMRGGVCDINDMPSLDPEVYKHLLQLRHYTGKAAEGTGRCRGVFAILCCRWSTLRLKMFTDSWLSCWGSTTFVCHADRMERVYPVSADRVVIRGATEAQGHISACLMHVVHLKIGHGLDQLSWIMDIYVHDFFLFCVPHQHSVCIAALIHCCRLLLS